MISRVLNARSKINCVKSYKDQEVHASDNKVTRFRYHCAQLVNRQKRSKKHEDTSKQRDHVPMERYPCEGWLRMVVNMTIMEVHVDLSHHHHSEYVDIRITEELKDYIRKNLRQTPRQLWDDLGARMGNVTEKQLHRCWMELSSRAWKTDEDQVSSAVQLIKKYDSIEVLFHITERGVKAIAFGIKTLIKTIGVAALEIGIDATCELLYQTYTA
jgi:hypothetical protein